MIEIDAGFIAMFGKHPDASHIAERFRIGFPPTSRSLDIGEQERHDPRRWVPRGHSHRMSHNALFNAAIVTNFRDSRNSSISRLRSVLFGPGRFGRMRTSPSLRWSLFHP